ncbi:MAG: serine/threonine-protein kinase, partial [Phycisphaerae bacterium]
MSAPRSDCPAPERLEEVAIGAPADASLEAHLADCARCRARLDQIVADNRFLLSFASAAESETDPSVALPELRIPGYELLRELHRGGQGVVYHARQQSTKRDVAIKVMRQGPFATLADRARFEREIDTLSRLEHPNIVTVHDAGRAGGFHYFVMPLVAGRPLDEWAADAPPAARRHATPNGERADLAADVLEVFIRVCEAVHAAHLRGIIHRDLKPSNIRVDPSGDPHVLDFGLAKPIDAPRDSAMTQTGQFVGSLPWAAPEQIEGEPARLDIRTDVYSLGVILYQLLTGALPYDVGSNLRSALDNILHHQPAAPSAQRSARRRGSAIDEELDTIVLKCLSKDRERRYQSAGELARDLRRYRAGEPIDAKRDSALYVLRTTLRRYRLRVAAAGAFVVLLVVFAIVMSLLYRR